MQAAPVEDIGPDGEIGLGQGGGLRHAHPLGDAQRVVCGGGDIFGVSASGQQGANLVARVPAADVRTGGNDGAGTFQTGQVAGTFRRVIGPGALQGIGPVHTCMVNGDQDVAGTGGRHRAGGELEDVGATGSGDLDGAHGGGEGHRRGSCSGCGRGSRWGRGLGRGWGYMAALRDWAAIAPRLAYGRNTKACTILPYA